MNERIARLLAWTRARFVNTAPSPRPTPPRPPRPAVISLPHSGAMWASSSQLPAPDCTCPAPPGTYVVDMRLGRLGQVMGHGGPKLQLRPPAGGPPWAAEAGAVRAATDAERLSAKVQVVNARGRWGK